MDMDTLDTVDTTDTPMLTMDLPTTERDLLMLSLRLMLILIFFMVDMDMDTLDMPDTTDTHMLMDMLTTESALPMPSSKADADPYLLYGGYGYGHLGYAG